MGVYIPKAATAEVNNNILTVPDFKFDMSCNNFFKILGSTAGLLFL